MSLLAFYRARWSEALDRHADAPVQTAHLEQVTTAERYLFRSWDIPLEELNLDAAQAGVVLAIAKLRGGFHRGELTLPVFNLAMRSLDAAGLHLEALRRDLAA